MQSTAFESDISEDPQANRTLAKEDLMRLLGSALAVFVEDNERKVMDVLLCLNIPPMGIDEGPDLQSLKSNAPLELQLGYFDEEGNVAERLYVFDEEELMEAKVEGGGKSLRFRDGVRISFLISAPIDKKR